MAGNDGNSSLDHGPHSRVNPKDALVMASILKEMGVNEYEPRLINQMLEFSYRYVTDVLEDARVYSLHASKKQIDQSDVVLAVERKLDHSFTAPPPREFLLEVARNKNAQPLPLIQGKSGLRLPPDRYCLTGSNYRSRSGNAASKKRMAMSSSASKFATSLPHGNNATKTGRSIPSSSSLPKVRPGSLTSHPMQSTTTDVTESKMNTATVAASTPHTAGNNKSFKLKAEATDASSTVASLPSMEETAASAGTFSNLLKRKREEDDSVSTP